MSEKLIVIGCGAAGISIASNVRKKDQAIEITIFSRDCDIAYSPCGIPYALSGEIPSFESLVMHDLQYYKDKGIDIRINTEVTAIDLEGKSIIADGKHFKYDKLAIATGARSLIPQVPGIEKAYPLRNLEDGRRVKKAMKIAKKAVIIGAGSVGLKVATSFVNAGIATTVVEIAPSILPSMLDPDMASILQTKLERISGLNLMLGVPLGAINGSDHEEVKSVTVGKEIIPADMVVTCTGTSPNTGLAREAGIEIGALGGITVDSRMQVRAMKNVYAAGDCVEVKNQITNQPSLSQFGSTAVKQARVVAENICGGSAEFDPVLSPAIHKIGDIQIGTVGVRYSAAKSAGLVPVVVGRATALTKARYYPGGKKIEIKLMVLRERLIGAQIVSEDYGVKERIDALALAIKSRMTVQQLLRVETCYTPPLAMVVDPLTLALEDVKQKRSS